jgi:hypothetical protein
LIAALHGRIHAVEQECLLKLDGEDLRREPSGNLQEHLKLLLRGMAGAPRVERQ